LFNMYDEDASGTIEHGEIKKLVYDHFPEATRSREGQQKVQKVLAEVDTDANNSLDFQEFLKLMRKCDNWRDAADLAIEQQVMQDCGLSPDEVHGFRHIFASHVDWSGSMKLVTLVSLLSRVVEINSRNAADLEKLLQEVIPHGDSARFPQFLLIIKRLTQDNTMGVNQAAARAVRRQ